MLRQYFFSVSPILIPNFLVIFAQVVSLCHVERPARTHTGEVDMLASGCHPGAFWIYFLFSETCRNILGGLLAGLGFVLALGYCWCKYEVGKEHRAWLKSLAKVGHDFSV